MEERLRHVMDTATAHTHAQRGAALVVVIGVLSILLVIAATVLVSTQEELQTSTNRGNAVRADLLAEGAIAVAQAFLNHDLDAHPTITSLDSAWRTYFNGAWAAGKNWMWVPIDIDGDGIPDVPVEFNGPAEVDLSLMPLVQAGIDIDGNPVSAPLFSHPTTRELLYVPRLDFAAAATDASDLATLADNPFVLSTDFDSITGLTRAEQVDRWADVDSDGDGLNDAIWLPIGADRFFPNDGVDNDLDGLIDAADLDGEAGIFIYYGGNDGQDNDGDGTTDEGDEHAWFTTVPEPFLDFRGDPLLFDWTLAGVPGVHGTSAVRPDVLDNDFTLLANDGSDASHFMNTDAARAQYGDFLLQLRDRRTGATGQILAEPVSELVGRMAILITDESSKVNLNAAGGYTLNDFASPEFVPPLALTHAFNQGVSAYEYDLRVVPQIGQVRSDRLWNYRMGAADGVGFRSADYPYDALDPFDLSLGNFGYDVSLPGYGGVDDNGNVLWMATNGIDDDGDGYVDEGLVAYDHDGDGTLELGTLEGIDEPLEFQQYKPYRNLIAEFDGFVDNDGDGAVDEIGELGDRVFRTLEAIMDVYDLYQGTKNDLRNFVTLYSADRGNRNLHSRDGGATIVPPLGRFITGVKQDYNLARAGDVAERLKEDFGYQKSEPSSLLDIEDPLRDEIRRFSVGLRREDVDIESSLILGGNADGFQGDAALRAQQLAANIADAVDEDYTRTEVTTSVPDEWWNTIAAADEVYRHITYTSAGIESIRINEIMVRPTRRIEAESTMDPSLPNLNPNVYSDEYRGTTDPDFDFNAQFTEPLFWSIEPFQEQSLLGLQSVVAVYEAYAGPGLNPGDDPIKNHAVFSFAESPELPAGNYYLLLNTMFPDGLTPSVLEKTDFEFAIHVGPVSDGVLLANDPFFPAEWHSPAVLGREQGRDTINNLPGPLTGYAFLQNENLGNAGFTVTVPPIDLSPDPLDPDVLHVGIRKSTSIEDALSINFFEFSQEPDHEWVEVINVAQGGEAIELSGWQLVVEGPARKIMTIPPGTFIAPGGMLLLGLNKYDQFEGDAEGFDLILENGIGLASGSIPTRPTQDDTFLNVTAPPYFSSDGGSVFFNFAGIDYIDNDGDGSEFIDVDGDGIDDLGPDDLVQSTTSDEDLFRRIPGLLPSVKAWDRIVEMYSTDVRNLDTAEAVGTLVLAGGIFPNYPEQNGIDDDSDAGFLEQNGYNDDGDALVDEDELSDFFGVREGIDEGRFRIAANSFDPFVGIPGSFTDLPIRFHSEFFDYDPLPVTGPSTHLPYLGSAADPPEWKEFVERRNFPGDNVIVTLYQGPALMRRVVDRITYTQRDVANRAIDDIIPIPVDSTGEPVREPLNMNNVTFWPENTMGIDFYRSLERKHPLYAGDRFGTQGRSQATDGNYDDWSPSTSRFVRILIDDPSNAVLGIADRFDDPLTDQLVGHTIDGSPLRMNYSHRLIVNPNGQFLTNPLDPQSVTYPQQVGWTFNRAGVRNRNLVSPGDLLSLAHFHRADVMSTAVPPQDGETINQSRRQDFGSLVTYRQDFNTREAMLAQHFTIDRSAVIGDVGAISPFTLSVGQATVYPLESIDPGFGTPTTAWGQVPGRSTILGVPEAWVPVLLYALPGDDPTERFGLGNYRIKYLMNTPVTSPPTVTQERWPLERRATMYVSGNFQGFDAFRSPHTDGQGAEALFVWDGEDGIENGEYDVFLGVGGSLERLAAAHVAYSGILTTGNTAQDRATDATDIGENLVGLAGNSAAREMMVDVEVFTDLNGDRRAWSPGIPTVPSDLNRGAVGTGIKESFGQEHGLVPGVDGIVHYGVVRIENNFLAVLLRNRAGVGRVNRFSRVILAPRNKTRGRINVNTVVTHRLDTGALFNPLMGLPGILPRLLDDDDIGPADPEYTDSLTFAGQITDRRGLRESPEGRYYELPSDLVQFRDSGGNVVLPLNVPPIAVDSTQVFDEHSDRYGRLANTVTTRSDVFEIIVTVQSGYGVDSNADGRINFRNDTEFVFNAEKKVRTVYER